MSQSEFSVQAMLCDYAEVAQQKLFVTGAGINLAFTHTTEAPHPVSISLAMLISIPWDATNRQHKLQIELVCDSRETPASRVSINEILPPSATEEDKGTIIALFNAGRSPNMQIGEETLMPVAIPFMGLPLPSIDSYYFIISIDGTEMNRVSFRVGAPMNQQSQFGMQAF
jgi:hypothetical protein